MTGAKDATARLHRYLDLRQEVQEFQWRRDVSPVAELDRLYGILDEISAILGQMKQDGRAAFVAAAHAAGYSVPQ